MKGSKRTYFDTIASGRIKQRKAKAYYWNDITDHCDFFIHPGHIVLEIGCGTGELLEKIHANKKIGIDFSPAMITEGKKQFPHLDLRVMAAEELKLEQKVDVVILSNLIGYLDDIQLVFEQLHSVCHPQTKIIVTYYNFLWEPVLKLGEWIGYKTKTPRQNWLSLSEINNLLFVSGFQVYRNSKRMLLPVYIPLLSELFNHFFAKMPFFRIFCINNYTFAKPTAKVCEQEDVSVSVIVPARNEHGNIAELVKRMPMMGKHTELIFVESGSNDDTWRMINEIKDSNTHMNIHCFQLNELGKAAAVRKGFDVASGDVLMILDADLTVAPEVLPKFLDVLCSGKGEFVNGSRLVYPMEKEAMRFLNLLGNKFFSSAFTWLLDQRIKDTLCGTKVMFRKDYERLVKNRSYFGDFDPFGDFDLLFGAYKLNLSITELPVRYQERKYGRTNISRFKHGLLLLKMCLFAARKVKFK
ncbi:MAG: glycosyltransferase [Bacteroidetes bacterium]|nr:glycosyltransferase [Bacteroidota bacterium]